jgi:DNA-binding beta-propeller fold protein YncE
MIRFHRDNPAGASNPGRSVWQFAALAAAVLLCAGARVTRADGNPVPAGKQPVALLAIGDGYGRGRPLKLPAGIWFDTHRKEIYVADRGNHKIAVFDPDGMPVRSFIHYVQKHGPNGKVALQPGEPRCVAVNSRGDIYIIDGLDDAVDVVDYRGHSFRRLRAADLVDRDEAPAQPAQATTPTAVAVDDADRVYIATTGGRCEIVVLDPDGQVLRRFGRRGKERGELAAVTGLFVDKRGRVLVTDAQGIPVQGFSPDGEVQVAFGEHGLGPQNFSLPNGAVYDANGDIWVADAIRQVVRRFDAKGQLRDTIGGLGTGPGEMYYPVALAGDGDRLVIVLEKNGARFQVFQVTS